MVFPTLGYTQGQCGDLKVVLPILIVNSYDYGAAIREPRALSPKFDELKRQALFIRSSPAFKKTDWIGDSSTGIPGVTVNGSSAFVTLLKNPDTGTGFIIARQQNSTST